jgi:flavin reductase (DIM6/NTAB) family NADH-FMN oxidoreductase RutF
MLRTAPINADWFRHGLGQFATGVVIVTARGPVGMCCNSFTSVSLEPPLVAFCAASTSTTWPLIHEAGRFAVNVLSDEQHEFARRFAQRGVDRFEGVPWSEGVTGSPCIDGVLCSIECEIRNEIPAGDHTMVVAEVVALDVADDRTPLVFFGGRYGSFG